MFRVILYNWYDNNDVMHTRDIPVMVINPLTTYKWIDDNGNVLIDENGNSASGPILDDKPCMINPSIKDDMGKAPSFDFTVNPGMVYYNAYRALKTLVRVDYGTDWNDSNKWKTIFFGQVKTINTSSLRQVKSIHVEGLYTVFADTVQEGIEEDFQIKKDATQLYYGIIAAHNSQIPNEEWWKKIDIGECNVLLDSESKKRDSSSWQTTQSALDQMIGNHGGYMRVRVAHGAQGSPFKLDWYRKYYRDLGEGMRPCFELAKNILDLSSTHEMSELFTRVIPIGHKANASGSSTSDSDYSSSAQKKERTMIYLPEKVLCVENINPGTEEELIDRFQSLDEFVNAYNYYGTIYKTVNFPNAYNESLLREYAYDWIKKNYYGALRSFSVKAVDMKMIGETDNTDDIIMAGDCVDIVYPVFDQNGNRTLTSKRRLVCKSVQIVLYNPEQNTYSIGVPNDAIDFEYGQKKKTGRASSTAAASTAERPGPGTKKYDLTFNKVLRYLYWFYYSNGWGDKHTAQKNHAYSWRTGGFGVQLTGRHDDKKPHNTCETYGMPKKVWYTDEDVTITQYDPAYPQDPNHIIGTTTERQRVEHTDYLYVLINGISKPVRIMGHYWTSPLNKLTAADIIDNKYKSDIGKYFFSDVDPKPSAVKVGYHYGFGWVENTSDCVAFSWNDYINRQYESANPVAIDAFFHYPNVFGRYVEEEGLSSADSSSSTDTGGNSGGKDDGSGAITFYDENGQPSAQIFPDSGRASYGPAIEHYDPETGEVVEPDPTTGEYPPGTETRQMRDPETGTPIFFTTINTPLYDSEGNVIVEAGAISTTDIQLPGIQSFKTEIAVINNLIAEKATIGELRAFTAMFGDSVPHDKIDPETGETVIDPTTGKPVQTYDGTQMDVTAKGILGVSGIFEKNADGTIKTSADGYPIVTGGGLTVLKNNVAIGLWDKGELSAGMFTEKDADGTYTGIVGDTVVVGNSQSHGRLSVEDLTTWARDPTQTKGFFSKYITAKRLTVGSIAPTDDSVQIEGNLQVDAGTAVFGTFGTVGQYTQITRGNIYSKYYNVQAKGNISFSGGGHGAADYSIGHTDAAGLKDTLSHVAVTQDASTDICTLWYLPSNIKRTGANTNPPTGSSSNNWVKAGTFRKAASSSSGIYLYGSWSSGVPSVFTAYTTNIPDRYGAHIKEFNIVFDSQNVEAYDHLTVNYGSITINANNTIDIPITVDSVEYSDGGADDDQYITRYSKIITGIDVSSVVRSVGVKYLGSYIPSGASESIHAVVPTTDSGKYNYIEISVDEGSLTNEGTTSGYRRVKVNAAGNGQTIPTAIKEWRINDYGTGYSAVTVTKVAIADNLGIIADDALRPTNISIRGTASNTKFLDATFHLGFGTAGTHRVVNLLQADPDVPTTNYVIGRINVDSIYNDGVQSVGVKYLGSYTPSGASESIHAVVPTTDSGKYNYIEISVDEGSLTNEGTTSGYRRVKVNAAGNGQAIPTAIKEWRINDYGTGYSAVTVTRVAIADNLGVITDNTLRPTNISIRGTASNTKSLDAIFHLGFGTAGAHRVVNLLQADPDVPTTNYVIGRINVDSIYNDGAQSVGVKYLGSYTPSGASEPIHAVVPTTDSGKYNYIEISVDEGSLINEGTTSGYRRVKVNAAGNGQTTPTAIKEWRIDDYGDGYSDGYDAVRLSTSWVNSDTQLRISKSTSGSTGPLTFGVSATPSLMYNTLTHKYTAYARAKINSVEHGDTVASEPSGLEAYNDGWDYGATTAFSTGATKISSPTSSQISSATQLDADAYYTINIKGKNHSNSNVNGTNLIVKTPAAPQIQITDRWADGTYTVKNGSTILASTTLSSQMTASGNPTQCTASGASDSTGKYVKQNYIVNYEDGNDATSTGQIVTAIVNASSVYNAGFDAVASPSFEKWTTTTVTTDITSNIIWFKTDDKINGTTKTRHGSRNVYLTGGTEWTGTTTKTTKVYLRDDSNTGTIIGQLTVTAPDNSGYTGLTVNSSSGKVVVSTTSTDTEVSITVTKPTLTYDSNSHRYTATATAKADSITMDTKTSDPSGDEAYGDGWNAGGATAWMNYKSNAPSGISWHNASENSNLGFGQEMCIQYRKYDGSNGWVPAYWKTPPLPTTIKPYANRAHVPAPVAAGVLSGTKQYWNFIAYDDSNNQLYDIQTNQSSNGFVIEPYDYTFDSNGIYFVNEAVRAVTVNVTISSDDIDIPTNYIYTTAGYPQGTELTRLRNLIRQAIKDNESVVFRVDAGGASKYYNLQF